MNTKLLVSLFLLPAASSLPARAQINLAAGDVAIIGWVDNGSPADALAIVCLADIPAGTRIGFTDNGWDSGAGTFRNTIGPHDGDGNEQLLLLSAASAIPKGTILRTSDLGPAFAWTTSGAIVGTGVTTGTYAVPNLAQSGDQVYAFQHSSGDNMLNTPVQACLFALDDTGSFESATSTATGDVPPGLSIPAHTALTFPQSSSGQDFMAFDTSVLASGTKAEWLAAIGNAANWTFGAAGTLPSGSILVVDASVGTVVCAGDGSGAACPCGNVSPAGAGEGCTSSLGLGGTLRASGIASLSQDSVVLAGAQMPNSTCLYFQGTTQAAGGAGAAFGDGLRCATGSIVRLGTRINALGASHYPSAGDAHVSAKGAIGAPATRTYQVWFRNAAAFCTTSTFNLTNGVSIAWGP
jgi:hypothetical protein